MSARKRHRMGAAERKRLLALAAAPAPLAAPQPPRIPSELELVAKALDANEDGPHYFHRHAFKGIADDLFLLSVALNEAIAEDEVQGMVSRIMARASAAADLSKRLYDIADGRTEVGA